VKIGSAKLAYAAAMLVLTAITGWALVTRHQGSADEEAAVFYVATDGDDG
jgi:hypothetical protein